MQAEAEAVAEVEIEVEVKGDQSGFLRSNENDLLLSTALAEREDSRLKSIMITCQTLAQLEEESSPAECDSDTLAGVAECQTADVLSTFEQDLATLSVRDIPLTATLTHSSSCLDLLDRKDGKAARDFEPNASYQKRSKLLNGGKGSDASPLKQPSCPQIFKRECTFDVSSPKAARERPDDARQLGLEVDRIVQEIGGLFVKLQLKQQQQQQLSGTAKGASSPKQPAAAGPGTAYVVTLQTVQSTPRCVIHPLDGMPLNIQKLLRAKAKAATAKTQNMPSGTPVSHSNHAVRVPAITIFAPNEENSAQNFANGRITSHAHLAPASLIGRQLQDAGVNSPLSSPVQKARSKSFLQPPKNYLSRKPSSK